MAEGFRPGHTYDNVYLIVVDASGWNQLDDTGHSLVRSRAIVKGNEMAKVPPKK